MKSVLLKLSTGASDGAATTSAPSAIYGILHSIEYQPGTIDTGATIVVTCVGTNGASKPLLTKASAGTSNLWFYPRDLTHAVADGAASTTDLTLPILSGIPKAIIASGGNSKVGYCILHYFDDKD